MEVVNRIPNFYMDYGGVDYIDRVEIHGLETSNNYPQPVKMKLKTLNTDAKDLFLCKNGEILFRVEE